MGNTRDTGYLRNLVVYDGSGNITLPANLTVTGTITGYATTSYVGTQLGGYVPTTRTISINGTSLDLSANRSFTINSMVYPGAGIAVSTGSAWGTSLTDNSSNWNTAYGWGNHAGLYSLLNHTHTFASLTSKPTTLVGYGITDAATSAQGTSADTAYGWGNHAIAGYLTGITSGQVTTALGYTPYNATNPTGYITTAALSTYATQSYVGTQIANLVASSPAALDTLNELAAALGNDAAFSTTVSTALGNRLRVDTASQGLSATLQGYGRTNLGLGTAATANTGDFVAYRTFGTAANSATGDFAAASHTHSIANVTGLQTALDGKQASGSYAASSHSHIISDVTGLQTALDGKQASLGFTPYNSTNPNAYIALTALSGSTGISYNSTTGAISSTITQYTDALARAAHSFVAGSGAYNSTTGVITIPTNNNQLTNGAGYITGYTETDTLQSVILRNAATNTGFTIENGNSTYSTPASTNVPLIYIHNTSTNANGHAILSLRSMGPSGGDPFLSLDIDGVIGWHVGVDNSDDDKFKIGKSWATVGSNTYLSIDTSGNTLLGGTLTASNFSGTHSGTSSGTNTGDQSLSGLGGAPNNATFSDANTLTAGGFFTGYNASNVPSGLSSTDYGLCNIPLWGGNGGSERYTMQLFGNLDTNSDFYIRKFKYYGAVNLSTWFKLLHSGNYSSYALPLSGGTISGNVNFQSTQPLTFTGNSNTGTFNQAAIYFNQNNVSGNDANGIFIERGRLTDSGSAEVRHFVIGARGGQIQWKLDGVGTSTQTGSVIASGLDISDNALLNKVKYSQYGYRVYRNLARFDNYNNGIGAIAINTNIPWTAANMLTIQVKGYRYGGDLFDITFGVYAGEGNFYSPCYASNSANRIFPQYAWYKDANNKVVLVLGTTAGSYGVQIWAAEYKQGFGGQDTTYADGWSITKITSTTGLSNGVGIPDKTYTGGVFNGDTITNSGISLLKGATRINDGTNGTSPKLIFGNEDESSLGFKGIYLESFWMYIQIHYNEGLRIRGTNGTGTTQICATFAGSSGNFTALGDVIAYSDARLKKDINTIDSALDKVLSLRGVSYYRTDVETDKKKIGLIAQEVAEILPEVVTENEDGMYSVAYGNIVGLLIEAVKEQQTQIESQKSEIDELKDLVQQLINR